MLDIHFIRDNPDRVRQVCEQKNVSLDVSRLPELDEQRRKLQTQVEQLRRSRNDLAEVAKQTRPSEEQIAKGKQLRGEVAQAENQLRAAEEEFWQLMKKVPNIPTDDTPIGSSEDQNVVTKTVGELPKFDFEPKNHWQIAASRGLINKERAAKVAGARFAYIQGDLVKLQFAIMQFTLSQLTDEKVIKKIISDSDLQVSAKPFVPILPPAVARTSVYEATGRLNKEEQTYKLEDEDLWLNASAEHTIAPMYWNEILDEADLPIRFVGYTTAFRREAGTYGKDMEGILRMHQFDKLELESFTLGDSGLQEHFLMIAVQEYLMQQLKLPYHVLLKCTADIGGPNARGVDLEVWLPGQGRYRESHTADYMSDYQARRMQTRVRRSNGDVELVHTNDATCFAMGRTMAAIIENYQQPDGRILVPEVLRAYMGGQDKI